MQKIISIKNLFISFGKENIIKNLSYDIETGDKVAIIGASGRGKSSLLNVLLGFNTNYKGEISIFNKLLTPENTIKLRKQIAWVPQEVSFDFDTSSELLLAPFSFAVNKANKPSKTEINTILNEFDLSEAILNKKLTEISGGQKQRIMLIGALLLKKELIFLDEPTSALDDNLKQKINKYVLEQPKLTVIASTHDNKWLEKSNKIINLGK